MARPPVRENVAGPPSSMPEGPPTGYVGTDYSFTMQMVGDLQKSVGILIGKVDRLVDDVRALDGRIVEHGNKIDRINLKLAWAAGVIATIVVLAGIVWTVATVVPWERISIEPPRAAPRL